MRGIELPVIDGWSARGARGVLTCLRDAWSGPAPGTLAMITKGFIMTKDN
jgi:hypothetical protein